MKTALYEEMYRQEETYWWHVAKRRLVQAFLAPGERVLDAGAGTGAMARELQAKFPAVFAVDGAGKALGFCRRRGIGNLRRVDFEKTLPYRGSYFSAVICLDTLEHIRNDRQLLGEFARVLVAGGRLYLTVPAYQFLWTYWDEMLGHKRRYRRGQLAAALAEAGFMVEKSTYFYCFLLPVVAFFRLIKTLRSRRESDFVIVPGWLNNLLLFFGFLERGVLKFVDLPVGLSIFMLARKR